MITSLRNRIHLNFGQMQNWIVFALIAFFIMFSIISVQKVSITFDEPFHYKYGTNILNLNSDRILLPSGAGDDSKMPISALNALPAKIASYLPGGVLRDFLQGFFAARLMTILFSACVAYLVFRWARELYGFYAGLAAILLYIFDPNIIAHSQLVTTDIYAAGTILFSCYWMWKFASTRTIRDGMMTVLMFGLGLLAKYTSIVLLPLLLLMLLFHDLPSLVTAYKEKGVKVVGRYIGQMAVYLVVACIFACLIVNAGFLFNRSFVPLNHYSFESHTFASIQNISFLQNIPIPLPYPYLQGLDRVFYNEVTGAGHGAIYLLGQLHSSQGFPGYFFVASILKVPIASQLILVISFVVYAVNRQRRRLFLRNEIFLLVPVIFYAIYFNFFYNTQIGIRFYLVVFPLLYVFAGNLFTTGQEFSRNQKIAVFVLAAWLVASVVSYYPYYLSYFNEIVWDRRFAYKYLSDSNIEWGQGENYLHDYRAAHPYAIYMPSRPRSGLIVVRADFLVGVSPKSHPDLYKWLRENFQPTGTIAYEYLVFDISPHELKQFCSTTNYCH